MKYFFNLSGAIDDFDLVGHEFPNLMAARIAAARFAGEFLRDRPGIIWHGEELRMEVTDADHLVQFVILVFTTDAAAVLSLDAIPGQQDEEHPDYAVTGDRSKKTLADMKKRGPAMSGAL